jgi:hypothetical protein
MPFQLDTPKFVSEGDWSLGFKNSDQSNSARFTNVEVFKKEGAAGLKLFFKKLGTEHEFDVLNYDINFAFGEELNLEPIMEDHSYTGVKIPFRNNPEFCRLLEVLNGIGVEVPQLLELTEENILQECEHAARTGVFRVATPISRPTSASSVSEGSVFRFGSVSPVDEHKENSQLPPSGRRSPS